MNLNEEKTEKSCFNDRSQRLKNVLKNYTQFKQSPSTKRKSNFQCKNENRKGLPMKKFDL